MHIHIDGGSRESGKEIEPRMPWEVVWLFFEGPLYFLREAWLELFIFPWNVIDAFIFSWFVIANFKIFSRARESNF